MAELQDNVWVEAVIEIPSGSQNKYEYDHDRRIFRLDRVMYSSVHYPTDYGFIPETLADDGDPLDILALVSEPTFPGCYLRARPIGTLVMSDEKGPDEKILAVLVDDPRYDGIEQLDHVQPHYLREIENFFATYKTLQNKTVTIQGWEGRVKAWEIIHRAMRQYHEASPAEQSAVQAPHMG
jgi:inorganic pyrophosphatase